MLSYPTFGNQAKILANHSFEVFYLGDIATNKLQKKLKMPLTVLRDSIKSQNPESQTKKKLETNSLLSAIFGFYTLYAKFLVKYEALTLPDYTDYELEYKVCCLLATQKT